MTSTISMNGRFALAGAVPQALPASAVRKATAEEAAEFARLMETVRAAERGPDPAAVARDRAVQAHTVVRQGPQIVAVIGRDGQVMTTNAVGFRMDWDGIGKRTSGMTAEQRCDLIAAELKKAVGGNAVYESYGFDKPAPTRGALQDEWNRFALAARRAAGPM